MIVSLNIDDETVSNLLCTALEGGSNYWYMIEAVRCEKDREFLHEVPFLGGELEFSVKEEGGGLTHEDRWILNKKAVQTGLKIMAEEHPRHFADVISDNSDGNTGDVFLQCALFGEVIFG